MPDILTRQQGLSSLHPKLRNPVVSVLKQLHQEGLNFEVFESWRTPQLQQLYYRKGRNDSGEITSRSKVVTYAKPWRSFHQYGLAVDLVLKENGKWSWNDTGKNAAKWQRMHAIARQHGLKPLSFEKPHIQLASVESSSQLFAGNYPAGGDRKWLRKLSEQISTWNGHPQAPSLPSDAIQRPAFKDAHSIGSGHTTGGETFPQIVSKILELEGGYSNHPDDPGGPTNLGITRKTLEHWRKRPVSTSEVRALSKSEASEIYRTLFFDPLQAGEMPHAVSLMVFNIAVLSGTKRGAKTLQQALNSLGTTLVEDGIIGSLTLNAVREADLHALMHSIHSIYLAYLRELPHWPVFGKGWSNRLEIVIEFAINNLSPAIRSVEVTDTRPQLEIYLFRGLFGSVFSNGIDQLSAKLQRHGFETFVHSWNERATIEERLLEDLENRRQKQVVLIGHSLGANTALRIARSVTSNGIKVPYLATIDATRRMPGTAAYCENFRSGDIRDRPVFNAIELRHSDLSHTKIDKDPRIHERIISNCIAVSKNTIQKEKRKSMQEMNETRGSGITSKRVIKQTPSHQLVSLIEALSRTLASSNRGALAELDNEELLEVINILKRDRTSRLASNPMTPVNSILGDGPFAKFLNGKKTAAGILGLVALSVLPALFPSAEPLLASLNAIGFEEAANNSQAGITVLTALSAGLAAWGGIGKMEKWIHLLAEQNGHQIDG